MKKVGILTLYKNNLNYGGMLQAYALQFAVNCLLQEDDSCVQISYILSPTPFREKLKHSLEYRSLMENIEMVMEKIERLLKSKQASLLSKRAFEIKKRLFEEFEKSIPHTEKCYRKETIHECNDQFTHLITGSDQVWNGGIDLNSFCLGFANGEVNRIAYAASSASTKFGGWQEEIFRKELSLFDAVSVREKSVSTYFERLTGKTVPTVLDPVFLLSMEEWRKIEIVPEIEEPYIFCYLLGSNIEVRKRATEIARVNHCKLVTIPYLDGYNSLDSKFGDIQIYAAGPKEFLGLIDHSTAIITDSFHATAFSIIFEKTFWAFSRFKSRKQGNKNHRVTDILDNFALNERFECDSNEMKSIDFIQVKKVMDEQKKEAVSFLKTALGVM